MGCYQGSAQIISYAFELVLILYYMMITVKYRHEVTKIIQGSPRLPTLHNFEKRNCIQDSPILPFNSNAAINTKDSFMHNFRFFSCLMILSIPICNITEMKIRLGLIILENESA